MVEGRHIESEREKEKQREIHKHIERQRESKPTFSGLHGIVLVLVVPEVQREHVGATAHRRQRER